MKAHPDVPVVQTGAVNGDDTPTERPLGVEDIDTDDSNPAGFKDNQDGDVENGTQKVLSQNGIDEGEVDIGDASQLDSDGRNKLFERGLLYEERGQRDHALKCYLGCLSGLTEGSTFSLLPQCLRNVADIYYQKGNYEKAVQFAQAEKLFYENALIDSTDLQRRIEGESMSANSEKTENGEQPSRDSLEKTENGDLPSRDLMRAEEYEHLAKLCLDRKQSQLALEYAGKATKIRQEIYGDNHPTTLQSLDFFATMYAEVGKQQYAESMEELSSLENSGVNQSTSNGPSGDEENNQDKREATPTSILRNRKIPHSTEKRRSGQHVHFREEDLDSGREQLQTQTEQEEWISNNLLVTLLFICSLLLLVLGAFLYCRVLLEGSSTCVTVKSYLHFCYMRLKYYYYYYSSTKLLKYA